MGRRGLKLRPIIKNPVISGGGSTRGAEDVCAVESPELVEPLSPGARIFHTSTMDCCIIAVIGLKTELDVDAMKDGLKNTLIKHPRFSSILVVDEKRNGEHKWVRTKVHVDSHTIVPDLDPNIDSPDRFVEDYVSGLTNLPIDKSKPMWELHLLNIKTSDANSIGVLKIHHSLGDGVSLTSLLLACTRKAYDPDAVPTLPTAAKKAAALERTTLMWRYLIANSWLVFALIWNTLSQTAMFVATALFLTDSDTPIKGAPGIERSQKRIVHRIISLSDIKVVKKAMNVTINDVLLGVTEAGLSRYLNRRYGAEAKAQGKVSQVTDQKTDYLPKDIRLRSTTLVNIRPSAGIQELAQMMEKGSHCRWGNSIGYIILPFHIALQDDPLHHIREAKAAIDKKKRSLEAKLSHYGGRFLLNKFGAEAASRVSYRVVSNTTMSFSNVAGPEEQISFYGHPIAYIAPTVFGHPQALTVHFQSYADKMIIVLAVDQDHIPDPHRFCDDLEESLQLMKRAVYDLRLRKNL